ncbi:hypothetical protein RvY_18674 [Ramazzottius varieornatus]|uniref:Protein quiver n=1 Tax=Ramazzottius varieornatus TaxID=947166 RepID=A0A1D1W6X4_RAMVA|nr:hypothetical protein RvY_18674 [Ramazzottius varieornatus]
MELLQLFVLSGCLKIALVLGEVNCHQCRSHYYEKLSSNHPRAGEDICEDKKNWKPCKGKYCSAHKLKGFGVITTMSRSCVDYIARNATLNKCEASYDDENGAEFSLCECDKDFCNNQTEIELPLKNARIPMEGYAKCYACELDEFAVPAGAKGSKDCFAFQKGPQFECLAMKDHGCVDTIVTNMTDMSLDTKINWTCYDGVHPTAATAASPCVTEMIRDGTINVTRCYCLGDFCNTMERPSKWYVPPPPATSTTLTTTMSTATTPPTPAPTTRAPTTPPPTTPAPTTPAPTTPPPTTPPSTTPPPTTPAPTTPAPTTPPPTTPAPTTDTEMPEETTLQTATTYRPAKKTTATTSTATAVPGGAVTEPNTAQKEIADVAFLLVLATFAVQFV